MKDRWWWPFGKTVWCEESIQLNANPHTHWCGEPEHTSYQHRCECGFRWAS